MKPVSQWSKPVLAFLAITAGIAFIVIADPPRNECDAQLEVFKQNQQGFLYKRVEKKKAYKPLYERLFKHCAATNSAGGCYELFSKTRQFLLETRKIPINCSETFKTEKAIKKALLNTYDLMVRIAWGDTPPIDTYDKNAWYDSSELYLFCDLQKQIEVIYGQDFMDKLKNKYLTTLPDIGSLSRTEAWQKSLLSTSCKSL